MKVGFFLQRVLFSLCASSKVQIFSDKRVRVGDILTPHLKCLQISFEKKKLLFRHPSHAFWSLKLETDVLFTKTFIGAFFKKLKKNHEEKSKCLCFIIDCFLTKAHSGAILPIAAQVTLTNLILAKFLLSINNVISNPCTCICCEKRPVIFSVGL